MTYSAPMLPRTCLFHATAILLFPLAPVCLAQSRSRVINGKNGLPLPKQAISIQFLREKPANASPPLCLKTDSNGEAHFALPGNHARAHRSARDSKL